MHAAFRQGGRQAIDKVMKNNPAMFLKMLVLLVPRELQIEHSNSIKEMSDEQLERTIEAVREMIAKRDAGATAKVINAEPMGKNMGRISNKSKSLVKSTSDGG